MPNENTDTAAPPLLGVVAAVAELVLELTDVLGAVGFTAPQHAHFST